MTPWFKHRQDRHLKALIQETELNEEHLFSLISLSIRLSVSYRNTQYVMRNSNMGIRRSQHTAVTVRESDKVPSITFRTSTNNVGVSFVNMSSILVPSYVLCNVLVNKSSLGHKRIVC